MPAFSRYRSALILAGAALAAASCSVQRAHTVPFDDAADNKGVVYSIPKTYLSITLQYAFTHDELHPATPQAHLEGALKVAPVLVPDEKSTFIIKTDGLMSNAMFLTSVNFQFAGGTLQAVDATSSDRTGEVIQELSSTAVNLAKAAAKGQGNPHDQAIAAAEKRIDAILAEIARVAGEPIESGRNDNRLQDLRKQLDEARTLISDLRTKFDPPIHIGTAPLNLLIDPDLPSRQTEDYLEYKIDPPQLFAEVPPGNMDAIYVRIYDDHRRRFTDSLHGAQRPADVGGVLYRQPVLLMTKILTDAGDGEQLEVFSGMLPYAQFAPPSVAALDARILTSKHTTLVLDPINGGLASYGRSQDSAIVNAAKSGAEISQAVVDTQNASKPAPAGRGNSGGGSGSGGSSGGRSGGSGSRSGTATQTSQPASQPATTRSGRGGTP